MKYETLGAVTTIETDNNECEILFISDVHFDSVTCDRKSFFADMDLALKKNAKIVIPGDFFDAMNGRFDPRRSMRDVRPEYRDDKYYDLIINDATKALQKYAKNIILICDGNHELSVLKNANTHLIDRLVDRLNQMKGVNIAHGGYGGWIRVMHRGPKIDRFDGTVKVKYFHGAGGEAPVTRGAIQTNRQAVFLPDADVVINGHSHNAYWIPITRERLSNKGELYFGQQHHIRTPGYQMSYGDGTKGWEVTRGGVPKPVGCIFMKTKPKQDKGHDVDITFEPIIHNPIPIDAVQTIYDGIQFPQE